MVYWHTIKNWNWCVDAIKTCLGELVSVKINGTNLFETHQRIYIVDCLVSAKLNSLINTFPKNSSLFPKAFTTWGIDSCRIILKGCLHLTMTSGKKKSWILVRVQWWQSPGITVGEIKAVTVNVISQSVLNTAWRLKIV